MAHPYRKTALDLKGTSEDMVNSEVWLHKSRNAEKAKHKVVLGT